MTHRIFEKDSYQRETEAEILFVDRDMEYVVLDQTIFCPEKGGQPFDKGKIGEAQILQVKEINGEIRHFVSEIPNKSKVKLQLDWERRFDHMQQHSGEHVLSGVMYQKYGAINKGFHLGENYVTADFERVLSEEELKELECICNQKIEENHPIEARVLEDSSQLGQYTIRKEATVSEDIRIVTIEKTDCVACCGTHVSGTAEIQLIKILKAEKNKVGQRIYFLCGKRAILDYGAKHEICMELGKRFSAETNTVLERIENFINAKEEILLGWKQTQGILSQMYWNQLEKEQDKVIVFFAEGLDRDTLLVLQKRYFEEREGILILHNTKQVVAKKEKHAAHLGNYFKKLVSDFHGKGGGNEISAQASFESKEDLESFVEKLKKELDI